MKAIADYLGYSHATVLKHKQSYPGMPINKVNGEWLGNTASLDLFMQDLAEGNTEKWLNPPSAKESQVMKKGKKAAVAGPADSQLALPGGEDASEDEAGSGAAA
jgi:hypothetical protein